MKLTHTLASAIILTVLSSCGEIAQAETAAFSEAHLGVRCFEDQRPADGSLTELTLALNTRGTYDLTLHQASSGFVLPGTPIEPESSVIVAHDLSCRFVRRDSPIVDCNRRALGSEALNSGFSVKRIVDPTDRYEEKSYFSYLYDVHAYSPELLAGGKDLYYDIEGGHLQVSIAIGSFSDCAVL